MIKTLELSDLNNILCSKFASTKISNNTVFKCNKCNDKEFTTMRSLSNHKRYCFLKPIEKNNTSDTQSDTNSENNSETNNIKKIDKLNIETKQKYKQSKKKNANIEVTM
jgi:hypothetical protein